MANKKFVLPAVLAFVICTVVLVYYFFVYDRTLINEFLNLSKQTTENSKPSPFADIQNATTVPNRQVVLSYDRLVEQYIPAIQSDCIVYEIDITNANGSKAFLLSEAEKIIRSLDPSLTDFSEAKAQFKYFEPSYLVTDRGSTDPKFACVILVTDNENEVSVSYLNKNLEAQKIKIK